MSRRENNLAGFYFVPTSEHSLSSVELKNSSSCRAFLFIMSQLIRDTYDLITNPGMVSYKLIKGFALLHQEDHVEENISPYRRDRSSMLSEETKWEHYILMSGTNVLKHSTIEDILKDCLKHEISIKKKKTRRLIMDENEIEEYYETIWPFRNEEADNG